MRRHPEHTLDSTLYALGTSAFRGANLDPSRGLGKFIALAEKGEIPRGSILMLESIDRFSRQKPRKAYEVFGKLVDAGVSVLTLDPETLIDETNIDDMDMVMITIIKMMVAHEESKKKSQRITAVWEARRQRAMTDGKPMTKRCPAWLCWDDKADKWKVNDGARRTIAYIFTRSCEGIGQVRLVKELQAKFPPLGKSKRWNGSMVSAILTSRAVLGDMTPCRERGKPKPPIQGYYPRMIDDSTWYRARAAVEARKAHGGRHTQFVNLFTGLVKFPDGHQGQIQTGYWVSGTGRHLKRRLASAGHHSGIKGSCDLTIDYFKVEPMVLALLYQLRPDDLFGKHSKSDTKSIKHLEQALHGMAARQAELEAALGDSKQPVPQLLTAIADLNTKAEAIKQEIEALRRHEATADSKPLENFKDIMETLEKKPEAEQHDLRLKLRGLIADIVERIEISPYREKGKRQVEGIIRVHYHNGKPNEIDTADWQGLDIDEGKGEQHIDQDFMLEILAHYVRTASRKG